MLLTGKEEILKRAESFRKTWGEFVRSNQIKFLSIVKLTGKDVLEMYEDQILNIAFGFNGKNSALDYVKFEIYKKLLGKMEDFCNKIYHTFFTFDKDQLFENIDSIDGYDLQNTFKGDLFDSDHIDEQGISQSERVSKKKKRKRSKNTKSDINCGKKKDDDDAKEPDIHSDDEVQHFSDINHPNSFDLLSINNDDKPSSSKKTINPDVKTIRVKKKSNYQRNRIKKIQFKYNNIHEQNKPFGSSRINR